MFKNIVDYFYLRQVEGIEMFFSSLLILSSYNFNGLPLQVLLWFFFFILLIIIRNKFMTKNLYICKIKKN